MNEILTLHLFKEYPDAIASGKKTIEYRKATPYWRKRIKGKNIIHFFKGYPPKGTSPLVCRILKVEEVNRMFNIHIERVK